MRSKGDLSKERQLIQLLMGNNGSKMLILGNGSEAGAANASGRQRNDPSNVLIEMNEELRQRLFPTLVGITVFLTLVSIFGGVGNSLVIYAFRRHVRRGSTNLFILLLAVIDLLNCILVIPMALYLDVWMRPTRDLVCKLQSGLKSTVVLVSPLVLVLIAVDRCLQICFVPGIQIRLRTAVGLIAAIFGAAAAASLPAGLRTGTTMEMRTGPGGAAGTPAAMTGATGPGPSNGSLGGGGMTVGYREYHIPCHTDYRFIGSGAFYAYQLAQSLAFFLMLVVLVLLYSVIFLFICWRHRRWHRRYPPRTTTVRRDSSPPCTEGHNDSIAGRHHHHRHRREHEQHNHRRHLERRDTTEADGAAEKVSVSSLRGPGTGGPETEMVTLEPITPDDPMDDPNAIEMVCLRRDDAEEAKTPLANNSNNNNDDDDEEDEDGGRVDGEAPPTARRQHRRSAGAALSQAAKKKWSLRRARSASAKAERQAAEKRKRKPHVKTAQTLAVVTLAFIVSFLPFQLINLHLIMKDMDASTEKNVLFYSYFINSAVNPVIYSCMNRMFRAEIRALCRRLR